MHGPAHGVSTDKRGHAGGKPSEGRGGRGELGGVKRGQRRRLARAGERGAEDDEGYPLPQREGKGTRKQLKVNTGRGVRGADVATQGGRGVQMGGGLRWYDGSEGGSREVGERDQEEKGVQAGRASGLMPCSERKAADERRTRHRTKERRSRTADQAGARGRRRAVAHARGESDGGKGSQGEMRGAADRFTCTSTGERNSHAGKQGEPQGTQTDTHVEEAEGVRCVRRGSGGSGSGCPPTKLNSDLHTRPATQESGAWLGARLM